MFIIFFGNEVIASMIGCVVAPTKPAIRAAANNVCFLKYGIKYFINLYYCKKFGSML